MKKIVFSNLPENFSELSFGEKFETFLNNDREIYRIITFPDKDTVFIGQYLKKPLLTSAGTIILKTTVISTGTYKKGHVYGRISLIDIIEVLRDQTAEYDFLQGFPLSLQELPKSVLVGIIEKKITSQEAIWKEIAHKSYRDSHWKIIKYCKQICIPFLWLKYGCKDYEAILEENDAMKVPLLRDLLKEALIAEETVSCKWSVARMEEELKRLRRKGIERRLAKFPIKHVWSSENHPALGEFKLIDSEKDTFMVSEKFHNCVYRNYWKAIEAHKYIVFASEDVCIGYQVRPDGDVWFDQCRGPYNSYVENEKTIDALIRPVAQGIVKNYFDNSPESINNSVINYIAPW